MATGRIQCKDLAVILYGYKNAVTSHNGIGRLTPKIHLP